MIIKRVIIFYNEHKDVSVRAARTVKSLLTGLGVHAGLTPSCARGRWHAGADLVVTVGGDGTVIHAARELAGRAIPLLGVNSGTLGFLSAVEMRSLGKVFRQVLRGAFKIHERTLLQVGASSGKKFRLRQALAFNDCVLRSAEPRAITLQAQFDGGFVRHFVCDGLIVSTPSGSTAYSLAASGPIVHPDVDALVLSPICPHSLSQRPLVLPANSKIMLTARRAGIPTHALVSLDGQEHHKLHAGETICVCRCDKKLQLLVPEDYDYFEVLSRKLKWGER